MINRIIIPIILFIWIQPLLLFSQGLFHIQRYDPDIYKESRQNWSIVQDDSGYIFFGNSAGIIKYDGVDWLSIHVPVGKIARTLKKYDGVIYWGGSGDLGLIASDSLHQFLPISLESRTDSSYQGFSNVWQIAEYNGGLIYRTSEGLFTFDGDSVRIFNDNHEFWGLDDTKEELIANLANKGLAFFDGESFKTIPGSSEYGEDRLYVSLPLGDEYLFVSRRQGFQRYTGDSFEPFETDAAEYVREHLIYHSTYINESEIALATLSGGIVIINTKGDWIDTITEEDGLPTNIIYDLYLDKEKILWAATDNGLAKIRMNDPLTLLDERAGLGGIPMLIETVTGSTYIGTTEGLFSVSDNGNVTPVENSPGRVYDGMLLDGRLIISTADGIYQVTDSGTEQLYNNAFHALAVPDDVRDVFYGARQQTILRMNIDGPKPERTTVANVGGLVRDLYIHDREIWVAVSGGTVYRFTMNGLPIRNYTINLAEEKELRQIGLLDGRIRLASDNGLYMYNPRTDEFEKDSTFADPEMVSRQVFRFAQCSGDEIWFRNDRRIKRAVQKNGKWEMIEDSYRTIGRSESIETIHCGDDGSVWFGGSRAVYVLSDPDWEYSHDFNTNITGLLVRGDSLVYGGYGEPEAPPVFRFRDNELRFTYAAASYMEPEANTYRTRLRGYEEEWSPWTEETQKDYTFIPEGTYTFEVQGRNVYHKTGSIDSFTFTVLPPWYRTIWAYLAYLLLAGGAVYGGYRIRLNTILREQRIRDGIARDLHDELSSTLSSINFFASAIEGRSLDEEKTSRFLSLISKSSSEAKEKISDIVWVIHSENDDWDNLLLRCKRFASDILEAKDINHSFNVKGTFPDKPDLRIRRNVWLCFREILTNIARHANPVNVDISIEHKRGKLHMAISDNGQGFDHDNIRDGAQGLQNIRTRIHQLRGHCSLESSPAEGTSWEIQIPL